MTETGCWGDCACRWLDVVLALASTKGVEDHDPEMREIPV